MPGKDPGGIFVTILIGIAGAIVGGFLGSFIGASTPTLLPESRLTGIAASTPI
jgi:uncharacterized membrane protein YeaQ/YmgE (transglycosylase-associated protein family)